jgi:hypothetical protein
MWVSPSIGFPSSFGFMLAFVPSLTSLPYLAYRHLSSGSEISSTRDRLAQLSLAPTTLNNFNYITYPQKQECFLASPCFPCFVPTPAIFPRYTTLLARSACLLSSFLVVCQKHRVARLLDGDSNAGREAKEIFAIPFKSEAVFKALISSAPAADIQLNDESIRIRKAKTCVTEVFPSGDRRPSGVISPLASPSCRPPPIKSLFASPSLLSTPLLFRRPREGSGRASRC